MPEMQRRGGWSVSLQVELSNGMLATIDALDADLVGQYTWYAFQHRGSAYHGEFARLNFEVAK